MRKLTAFGWLVAAFAVMPAQAVEIPSGSPFDARIQHVKYNAGDVVTVRAVTGLGGRIVFGEGEEIKDVATGFTEGWELRDRANVLYVKPQSVKLDDGTVRQPKEGEWDTNLMVKTMVGDTPRFYDFDLKLIGQADTKDKSGDKSYASVESRRASFRVVFEYPDEQAAKSKAERERKVANAASNYANAPKNWDYTMQAGKSSSEILPTMAYDDGRFTFLRFAPDRPLPAVFEVAEDKSESVVNWHIEQNDLLVIHSLAREFVLRHGTAVVSVYNEGYGRVGLGPIDGTSIPSLKRSVKADAEEVVKSQGKKKPVAHEENGQ